MTWRWSSLAVWLRLCRLPNLLTAPGDALAGFCLTAGPHGLAPSRLVATAGASVSLYAAGVILNDIVDFQQDRRERPTRPLPSGAVRSRAAGLLLAALLYLGCALGMFLGPRAFACSLALLSTILCYNLAARRWRWCGALVMGLCRGLNVMFGAAATGPPFTMWAWRPLAAAGGMTLYIGVVTWLAAREVSRGPAWQRGIERLLGGLLPLQALLIMASGAGTVAVGLGLFLLLLWPAHARLRRTYYAT